MVTTHTKHKLVIALVLRYCNSSVSICKPTSGVHTEQVNANQHTRRQVVKCVNKGMMAIVHHVAHQRAPRGLNSTTMRELLLLPVVAPHITSISRFTLCILHFSYACQFVELSRLGSLPPSYSDMTCSPHAYSIHLKFPLFCGHVAQIG